MSGSVRVTAGAQLEQIATGFSFAESPLWADGGLLFHDLPGDQRLKWLPGAEVSVVASPTNKANGMARDHAGKLVVCEHATSVVVRDPAGSREIVASHYEGKQLNSPNDLVIASDGSILFTDPSFGRMMNAIGRKRDCELDVRGVFRARPGGGELQLLVSDCEQPNGICLSPDETRLYVNDTPRAHIRVFDVGPDFQLSGDQVFADGIGDGVLGRGGIVDGMAVDSLGNLYVTGPDGIWVFDPAGNRIEVIAVPEITANVAWGDEDLRSLYIAATTSIYRMRLKVEGHRFGGA